MTQTIVIGHKYGQDTPVAVEIWEECSGMDRLIQVIELSELTEVKISDTHYLVVRQL